MNKEKQSTGTRVRPRQRPASQVRPRQKVEQTASQVESEVESSPELALGTASSISLEHLPVHRTTRALRQSAVLRLQRRHGNIYARGVLARRALQHSSPVVESSGELQPQRPAEQTALLRVGSSGPAVEELQSRLNNAGARPPLAVDGRFGPATRAAVLWFQRANSLDPDGMVGSQTRAALDGRQEGAHSESPKDSVRSTTIGSETSHQEVERGWRRAHALFRTGRYAQALAMYERYYSLTKSGDRQQSMAWWMANCYRKLGRHEQAISLYQQFLLFPGGPQFVREAALDFIRQLRAGEKMPAAATWPPPKVTPEQRAAADATANKEIALGGTAERAGQYGQARKHMMKAYSLRAASDEKRSLAAVGIARAHQHLGQYDRAIDLYNEALAFPGTTDARRLNVLERIRQCRQGKTQQTEPPTTMTKEQLSARWLEGTAAYKNGEYAVALSIWKEIYLNPDAPPKYRFRLSFNIGRCYQNLGKFDQAIAMFEEFLRFPASMGKGDDKRATEVFQRLRMCRARQVGTHLRAGKGAKLAGPGGSFLLWFGTVYFETGSADVGGIGQGTLRHLLLLLSQKHKAEPDLRFEIELLGAASSRWQSAGSTQQARQRNMELSRRRAANVEKELRAGLPASDVAAGVYLFDVLHEGSWPSHEMGLDSRDNTWTMRRVALRVLAARKGSQT